jgi:polysaccharide pyruvyl transferase WcaK-like protein
MAQLRRPHDPRPDRSAATGSGPRILVVAGNTFQNKGDAALMLALDAELRRTLPEARVTISLRAPARARAALPHRTLVGQPISAASAPFARLARLAIRFDGRLVPAVAVAQAMALVAWLGIWSRIDRRAPRVAARLLPGPLRRLALLVRESDVVVAAPGGYILTTEPRDVGWTFACAPLMAARVLGVPVILAPMTIGPIPRVQRPAARLAFAQARLVLLREARSLPWALRCGVPRDRVEITADMAWLAPPADEDLPAAVTEALAPRDGTGPLVGVAVREFRFPRAADRGAAREAYLSAVAAALDRLVERRAIRPVFLAQVLAPPVTDAAIAHEVARRMRHAAVVLEDDLSPAQLHRAYGRLDLLIGVRMHAGILAMAAGTPFVGIAYGIKHAGIMEDLGLVRYLADIDRLDPDWLVHAVESALDERPAIGAILDARLPELRARIRAGDDRLADLVRAAAAPSTD